MYKKILIVFMLFIFVPQIYAQPGAAHKNLIKKNITPFLLRQGFLNFRGVQVKDPSVFSFAYAFNFFEDVQFLTYKKGRFSGWLKEDPPTESFVVLFSVDIINGFPHTLNYTCIIKTNHAANYFVISECNAEALATKSAHDKYMGIFGYAPLLVAPK